MRSLMTFFMFLLLSAPAYGVIGCVYYKRNVDSPELDFKKLHYVRCSCPCWKKYQQLPGNICSECRHLHLLPRNIYLTAKDLQEAGYFIKPKGLSSHSFYDSER